MIVVLISSVSHELTVLLKTAACLDLSQGAGPTPGELTPYPVSATPPHRGISRVTVCGVGQSVAGRCGEREGADRPRTRCYHVL